MGCRKKGKLFLSADSTIIDFIIFRYFSIYLYLYTFGYCKLNCKTIQG